MYARLGLVGIMAPVVSVCSHKMYNSKQTIISNQMTLRTSDDLQHIERKQTSAFNKYVLNNGMKEICMSYIPPWFYFDSLIAVLFSSIVNSQYAKTHD